MSSSTKVKNKPAKIKPDKPMGVVEHVRCRACGEARHIDDYRLFKTNPRLYMDFCVLCERHESTIVLYRRFTSYGTPEITQAVFAADRALEARRSTEQVRLLVQAHAVKAPETNAEILQVEVRRRELARRSLIYFTTTFVPGYKPGWVHHDIARRLEKFMRDVEAGKSPRLIIAMPPRAGKSALASDCFPSWILGHHPEWSIIGSSYAQSLPLEFSRAIRDRMLDPEYKAVFPDAHLRADSRGVEAWKTSRNGGYIAAGVGTGINGKGMHIGILDDALKDEEAAASETIRDNTFKWYQSVFRTRLAPGGGILIIATRWHFADPTGKVLEIEEALVKAGVPAEERENWDLISYPAIAEQDEYLLKDGTIRQGVTDADEITDENARLLRRKGDALHAERYTVNDLRKLKHGMAPLMWSALYQQSPTPEDGDFFKKDDYRERWLDPAYRSLCKVFITADYAIGKKDRNNFTVLGAWALDSNDDLYLLEIRRGRWKTREIAENAVAMVASHNATLYAGEQGQIHHAVWPIIEEELIKQRLYPSVNDTLVPIQDKEVRARPLQGRVQRHKLFFSFDTPKAPDVYGVALREMLQFPNGLHDDCVDMMAWGARLAMDLPLPVSKAPVKRPPSWKDQLTASTDAKNFMAA